MSQVVQYNVRDGQGNVYGPATGEMLRQWVREGRIVAGMAIAPEGTENWIEVSVHPSLMDLFGGTPAGDAVTPVVPVTVVGSPAGEAAVDGGVVPTEATGSADQPGMVVSGTPQAVPTGNTPVVRAPMDVGYQTPATGQMNQLGLFSFIVGILALLSSVSACCCYGTINGLLGLVAVILGMIAISQNRKEPGRFGNNWMAVTGVVLGGLALLLGVLAMVLMVIALMTNSTSP